MPSSFLTALGAHVLVEASPCIKPATSSTSNRVTYACMCVCVCVCALASDSRKHMSVWLRHVCAPRKCEVGVAVHLLHHLPLLPPPPRPAPRAAALPRLPRSAWPVQGGMLGPAPPVWTRVCACACACARWRVIHASTCLAPPLFQDFQGVRGRFKEGCLDRLRRCGRVYVRVRVRVRVGE